MGGVVILIIGSTYLKPEEKIELLNPLGSGRVSPTAGVYLQIPTKGMTTRLAALMGTVNVIPWDSPDEVPATAGSTLVQGDAVVTKANAKAKIIIESGGELELDQWTKLTIASLLEETLSVRQDGGTSVFTMNKPLSVRLKSALVEVENGQVRTTVAGNTIRIDTLSGSARVAYVDVSGKTKVWRIAIGRWVSIDDGRRRVRTNGVLVGSD